MTRSRSFLRSTAFKWSALILMNVVILGTVFAIGATQVERYVDRHNVSVQDRFFDLFPFVMPDEEYGWRNRPGDHIYSYVLGRNRRDAEGNVIKPASASHHYTVSEAGLRVDDYYQEHPLLEPRMVVWVIGDSSAFGLGEAAEETFAGYLRPVLARDGVLLRNFAVVGYNSSQLLRLFSQKLESEERLPEVVVFWGGFNDVEWTTDFIWHQPLTGPLARLRYKWNFRKLVSLCEERNIRLIANTLPSAPASEELVLLSEWLRRQEAPEDGVLINDVLDKFLPYDTLDIYSKVDWTLPLYYHPNAKGHAVIARMLTPKILGW